MKLIGIILLALIVLAAGGMLFLAQQSKNGKAPGLANGTLAPCPSSPNCVSSEAGTPESHAVAPLPASSWDELPALIADMNGEIVVQQEDYIAAEFATPTLKFVDDVEFRKADDAVHVRSASRVGHSDLGANRKRVEAMREKLGGKPASQQ